MGAAFSGDGVRIRGECDTFCARVKSLTQLSRILGGETERAHRAWQTCLADLWEPGRSGIYHAGVLREKAAAGVLCAGHRVCIADDGGETFHFDLAGGKTPMERALRGRLVGDAVTVDAPGGAYQCRVIGVDAPCAA